MTHFHEEHERRMYRKSKERHLDLKKLLYEHFCADETEKLKPKQKKKRKNKKDNT